MPSYLSGIDQTFENSAKPEYTWERENQLFNENDTSASIEESNKIESSKVAESSTTSAEQIDTNDEVLKKAEDTPENEINNCVTDSSNVTYADVVKSGVFGTSKWNLDTQGTLVIGSGEFDSGSFGGMDFLSYGSRVQKIVFEGKVIANPNSSSLFQTFTNSGVELVNINYLNTSKVTNMSYMFANFGPAINSDFESCLDLSSFDTSKVTNMSYMFANSGASKINLSSFDMSNVSAKTNMFNVAKPRILILGSKVTLDSSVSLSNINANDVYTGKWINVGNGSEKLPSGNHLWTSDELLKNFNAANADTYVWQEKGSISVKYFDIDKGKIIPSSVLSVNPEITNGLVGERYTINEKKIENYTFVKYTDTSKNTISNTGIFESGQKSIYAFYSFNEKKLTAEPVSQKISLGNDISKIDYSKFITNVKLGDQLLSSDQYKVELINSLATDTVGTKNVPIRVTLKSDTSKTVEVDVSVKIEWGNSVVYGSYDYVSDGRTSAAFTLYTESKPRIAASQGKNDDNKEIHSNFSNQQYYTFNWFDLSSKQILKIDESNNGDKYIKANGKELKKDKLKEWGTAQNQVVNYGDIVRAWQTETSKNWLYENEQKKAYNDSGKSVYYEITTSGYRPLHFNQLTTKTGKISIYSTNQYLDEHITDYIDLKGYSNISVKEFSQYPNTKASGQQKGKIIVEETLTTGKKVQYEYEVTFTIGDGKLEYSVPKTLIFKEFTKSKSEQVVQRMDSGDLGLEISDNRGQGKQGNWRLTAQVRQSEEVSPYLIFRDDSSQDKYLYQGATEIYSQSKQSNPTEPLDVEVSGQWKKDTGILLKVPPKNNLSSKQYTSTITWNLVEGP